MSDNLSKLVAMKMTYEELEKEMRKRPDFFNHIRSHIIKLYLRKEPIEYDEFCKMRMSSYERTFLVPAMSTDCLLKFCQYAYCQDITPHEKYEVPVSYRDAILHCYVPEMMKRLSNDKETT